MLMMGLQDGSMRIHSLNTSDIGALGPCWQMSLHDNTYGRITRVSMSFDEKFLFTVGRDGNFFTFNVMDQQKIQQQIEDAKVTIPSARVSSLLCYLDIQSMVLNAHVNIIFVKYLFSLFAA